MIIATTTKRPARCNLLWNIQSIKEKIFRLISSFHKFGMWTESQTELLITAEQSNCPNKDIFMKGSSFAHVEPSDSQSSGPSVTLESSKLSCAARQWPFVFMSAGSLELEDSPLIKQTWSVQKDGEDCVLGWGPWPEMLYSSFGRKKRNQGWCVNVLCDFYKGIAFVVL